MAEENFFDRVYEVVRLIPAGRVTSYGAIAQFLGSKGSARIVGYAMGAAGKAFPPVPAHRVVNSQGLLTGKFHFDSFSQMEDMLASEGIMVEDSKVQNFKKVFWDPSIELTVD
ncbi:MGMT family protein [Mucilaginibacter limnophilus]|uniref:MGMT family protein n=1 Tax=Mucilaginibacter limnophilus TaxID=1932778 RepID=A0A3S2WWK0_9SPHI|nr:MGMT family protein [Mucilaginibacter limnophilus]RVT98385.1 MGMT family protein [Mucilaginibacter limnophilus]